MIAIEEFLDNGKDIFRLNPNISFLHIYNLYAGMVYFEN
jgi:hypothetical protein